MSNGQGGFAPHDPNTATPITGGGFAPITPAPVAPAHDTNEEPKQE